MALFKHFRGTALAIAMLCGTLGFGCGPAEEVQTQEYTPEEAAAQQEMIQQQERMMEMQRQTLGGAAQQLPPVGQQEGEAAE